MINELKAVEKLIKDRITEASTELTKQIWKQETEKWNKLLGGNNYLSVIFEIDRLGKTLNIIQNEISTLQAQKHDK